MTRSSAEEGSTTRSAPQLLFDDGSRVIHEDAAIYATQQQQQNNHDKDDDPDSITTTTATSHSSSCVRDPSVSIRDYYEIDRLALEIQRLRNEQRLVAGAEKNDNNDKNSKCCRWRNRIALQFPDELLGDAPDVCWEMERTLSELGQHQEEDDYDDADASALVFVLGDTTYQPCCPDVVAAAHLNADCIVHYGHACLLSTPASLPVLYSFGKQALDVDEIAQAIVHEQQRQRQPQQPPEPQQESLATRNHLLILYEVKYAHAMAALQQALSPYFEHVLLGKIPSSHGVMTPAVTIASEGCSPQSNRCGICSTPPSPMETLEYNATNEATKEDNSAPSLVLGGLQIPPVDDWSRTTLLYIGQEEDSRPLQNIMLRFLSSQPDQAPAAYWTWNPNRHPPQRLSTQPTTALSRLLQRRFFLIQKCKLARVFGILVANLSDAATRPVVRHVQALLQKRQQQQHGVAVYTFLVGKINPAKLANFPEVDVYCLVACPEHALLEQERSEYLTPILTPLEVAMALDSDLEWGTRPYSLDAQDFLRATLHVVQGTTPELDGPDRVRPIKDDDDDDANDDDDNDVPYFNPVTGQYESTQLQDDTDINLQVLPGQGQLTTYQSAAAEFLRQRTYQGLTVDAGENQVRAAIPGQRGIASDYGNR